MDMCPREIRKGSPLAFGLAALGPLHSTSFNEEDLGGKIETAARNGVAAFRIGGIHVSASPFHPPPPVAKKSKISRDETEAIR